MSITVSEKTAEHQELIKEILNFDYQISAARPATLKDGIRKLNKYPRKRFLKKFNKLAKEKSFCNFIPASGSGSRMFKDLIVFVKNYDAEEETFSSFINRTKTYSLKDFFFNLKKFPFYTELPEVIVHGTNVDSHDAKKLLIANFIINELKPQKYPKALLTFHSTRGESFTALHQHYKLHKLLADGFNSNQLIFTINEKHTSKVQNEISSFVNDFNDIRLGYQSKESEAFCLNKYNNLVTLDNGSPLKKPSGHGALLENLNAVDSDIIHIHNIDNIPNGKLHRNLAKEKKVLMGYLFFIEQKIHKYLTALEYGKLKKKKLRGFKKFCKKYLQLDFDRYLEHSRGGINFTIYSFLNRPIRVCAMVKSDGHTGGGPFWVANENGQESLQILESIELADSDYKSDNSATHFNPVEIFCSTKDYKGQEFELSKFTNNDRKMLVNKTFNGSEIKFFERPGLWNGAMHNWLTVFVEMDGVFFNPVKKITDLLQENHLV